MIFTKETKNKSLKKRKVVFIFFQMPSAAVLSKVKDYLTQNGFFNSGYFAPRSLPLGFNHIGTLSDFPEYVAHHFNNEIIIIGNPKQGEVSQHFLLSLKLSGATIKLIPIDFNLLTGLIQMGISKDLPHIRLYPNSINTLNRGLKWVTDKFFACLGIILTAIAFPLIAILIKSTSKGPVLYHQKRLGKHARPFTLYKFRTMYLSAEDKGPQLSHSTDKRITRTGRLLRYWHIDELPQFWNILKGDMALIGPRPERPFFARFLATKIPYYKIIYQEKPGLTSLGMVKYGYASSVNDMTDRLYYDIVYLNHPSFMMDLKIMGHTFWYIILKTFYDPSIKRKKIRNEQIELLTEPHDPLVRWLSLKNNVNG